jgi:hypothetical protein
MDRHRQQRRLTRSGGDAYLTLIIYICRLHPQERVRPMVPASPSGDGGVSGESEGLEIWIRHQSEQRLARERGRSRSSRALHAVLSGAKS